MKVNLRFFASLREALGFAEGTMETTASTAGELRDELIAQGGVFAQVLARSQAIRVAVDHNIGEESTALRQGCEVAFFPPVTGG